MNSATHSCSEAQAGVCNKMKTIVVAGTHSGIGKTLLVEELLHTLPKWSALKVTVSPALLLRRGGVKRKNNCPRSRNNLHLFRSRNNLHLFRSRNKCNICAELKKDFEIIEDKKVINQKGTDTARLRQAGAKKVVWLKTTLSGLKAGLKKALYQLKDSEGVVIEGTTVLRYIRPDLAIYLKDNTVNLRMAARQAQRKADIIINVDK